MRKGKRVAGPARLGFTAVLVAALALVAVTAAPAKRGTKIPPSPLTGIIKQVRGKSLKQREAILYRLAKQEGGQLNWYTSLSKTIYPGVISAFEAKYPGITVNVYRGHSEDVSAKLYQEESAGTAGADVVETNGTELLFYQHKKDIVVQYQGKNGSPYARAIPKAFRSCCFTADRVEGFVLAWNTNMAPSLGLPKSWDTLAAPQWKGKFEMEPGDVDWFAGVYKYQEEQALKALKKKPKTAKAKKAALRKIDKSLDAEWRKIAANAQLVAGHTTEATFLAAGQYAGCIGCHAQSTENLRDDKHAPIDFNTKTTVPAIMRPQGIGIVYRLQHPATAMLFYDWMLRPDGGQKALLTGGASPAIPRMADPALVGGPHYYMPLFDIVHHYGFWAKKYDQLVRLGTGG